MQTDANISLILTDGSSSKGFTDLQRQISYRGFYQHLASGLVKFIHQKHGLCNLGERLVVLAERAHAFRQMDALEQVSQILVNSPLPRPFEAVGRYYLALCTQRLGLGDSERAANLLEDVLETAPTKYKARAIISLAANCRNQSDSQSALSLYCEAAHFASISSVCDPYTTITAQRMAAVISSEDGNHRGALALLENLSPLAHFVRSSQSHLYHDYLNSLAVELCVVGRLEEARNVAEIVLASPFASAYPEWRETLDEIELRGWRAARSVVAVTQPKALIQETSEARTLVRLPVAMRGDSLSAIELSTLSKPARVLSMQDWKKRMPKQLTGDPQDRTIPRPTTGKEKQARAIELRSLDTRQMLLRLMKAIGDEDISDDQLFRALIILEGADPNENQGA